MEGLLGIQGVEVFLGLAARGEGFVGVAAVGERFPALALRALLDGLVLDVPDVFGLLVHRLLVLAFQYPLHELFHVGLGFLVAAVAEGLVPLAEPVGRGQVVAVAVVGGTLRRVVAARVDAIGRVATCDAVSGLHLEAWGEGACSGDVEAAVRREGFVVLSARFFVGMAGLRCFLGRGHGEQPG